jgi:hypothetical protein
MYSFTPLTRANFYYYHMPGRIVRAIRKKETIEWNDLPLDDSLEEVWESEEEEPLAVIEQSQDPYKRTNYVTDDSDSDLDVFVDPEKAKVPRGERPENLFDHA